MPRVSVVLPVHNGARHIRDAVASVVAQTCRDWELLVVDDGSTDDSCAIVAAFDDPRIRTFRLSPRGGISGALNHGLREARGEFVARMDADDICAPRRLERQVRRLEARDAVDVCGSWVLRFDERGGRQVYRRPVAHEDIRAHALFDNPMVHSSVMMRRRLFVDLGLAYDGAFNGAEDYDLWVRAMAAGCRFVNIPQVLLDYRVHGESVTCSASSEMDRKGCIVLERQLARLGLPCSPEEVLFHRYLATHRLYPARSREAILRAGAWLGRILEANRTTRVYPVHALSMAVSQVWYELCYDSLAEGSWAVRQYLAFQTRVIPHVSFRLLALFIGSAGKSFLLGRGAL